MYISRHFLALSTSMANLLFSFTGRINRLKWWFASISVTLAGFVLAFVAAGVLAGAGIDVQFNSEAGTNLAGAVLMMSLLAVYAYVLSALAIKRFNDRDRPHWLLAVYWSPLAISLLNDLAGSPLSALGPVGIVVNALLFAVSVWMVVELGVLRGVPGPNRHGPDPLASRHTVVA